MALQFTCLIIVGAALVAVNITGNPIYDVVSSIIVGNVLALVAIFLIQRIRHSLIGSGMDDNDVDKILRLLKNDPFRKAARKKDDFVLLNSMADNGKHCILFECSVKSQ